MIDDRHKIAALMLFISDQSRATLTQRLTHEGVIDYLFKEGMLIEQVLVAETPSIQLTPKGTGWLARVLG